MTDVDVGMMLAAAYLAAVALAAGAGHGRRMADALTRREW